jgi:hypothetical protein
VFGLDIVYQLWGTPSARQVCLRIDSSCFGYHNRLPKIATNRAGSVVDCVRCRGPTENNLQGKTSSCLKSKTS